MLQTNRESKYKINSLLLNRYSPRALSGEAVAEADLLAMLEAAGWAPSSFNNQPWRFIYAKRDTQYWPKFLNFINDGNRSWVDKAGALIILLSRNNFTYDERPSRTHSLDAGAAWENLALEAASRNLVAHAIEGFDYDKVRADLIIPDNYTVEVMIAVGKLGDKARLPEHFQAGETPSTRKELAEIASEGEFKFS